MSNAKRCSTGYTATLSQCGEHARDQDLIIADIPHLPSAGLPPLKRLAIAVEDLTDATRSAQAAFPLDSRSDRDLLVLRVIEGVDRGEVRFRPPETRRKGSAHEFHVLLRHW
jgi:hypothetical protein